MVLSELGAGLLFTQIKLEGRKSSFVNLSREHASSFDFIEFILTQMS